MCIRDSRRREREHHEVLRRGHAVHEQLRAAHLVRHLARRCLLYTSDAADERSSVDLGGRRIIKKNITESQSERCTYV